MQSEDASEEQSNAVENNQSMADQPEHDDDNIEQEEPSQFQKNASSQQNSSKIRQKVSSSRRSNGSSDFNGGVATRTEGGDNSSDGQDDEDDEEEDNKQQNEQNEGGESNSQDAANRGEPNNNSSKNQQEDSTEGNLQRRLSSRKRNKKQIDDMDFGYRKIVTPIKKVKKSKSSDPKPQQKQQREQPANRRGHAAVVAAAATTLIVDATTTTPAATNSGILNTDQIFMDNENPVSANAGEDEELEEEEAEEEKNSVEEKEKNLTTNSAASKKKDRSSNHNSSKKDKSSGASRNANRSKSHANNNQNNGKNSNNNHTTTGGTAKTEKKNGVLKKTNSGQKTNVATTTTPSASTTVIDDMGEGTDNLQDENAPAIEERVENRKKDKVKRKDEQRSDREQNSQQAGPVALKPEKEVKEKKKKEEVVDKEQAMLDEQQNKRDKKDKQIKQRNPNRRIFNPAEYNENLKKKLNIENQLSEIREVFGRKMERQYEPKPNQTHWDFILQEIQETAEYFQKRRSYFKFQTRKIAKHSVTASSNLKHSKEQKVKEEAKRIRKIAESCNQMVQRYFWRSTQKVKKFMKVIEIQQEQKEDQQKRLNSLVSEQLNLSSKLAKLQQIAKELPELDTLKAIEESKAKSNQRDLNEQLKREETARQKIEEEEQEQLRQQQQQQEQQILDESNAMALETAAVAETKLENIKEEPTEEQILEELRRKKLQALQEEEEIKKEIQRIELLEEELLQNEELAQQYSIHIDLKRDDKYNYFYDKIHYISKEEQAQLEAIEAPQETEEQQQPPQPEEEEEEEEEELDQYGNIKLSFHDFEPQAMTLNDATIVQPFLLKGRLREYQLIGSNWLATLQQKKMNGILADEMGLGKTIQTISLLAHLACNKGIWGPHLIIVPTSILINWEIEFKKWCPAFKIMTYYGSPKERKLKRTGWSKMNHFQVCITSYKIALQDQKIFKRKKWYFMVLDEAQNIKNFKSQRWQVLLSFHTKHRLLLTGTPLQNDVGELWSLLHFLMPRIFDSHSDFMEWFSIPMQQALQKNLPISSEILTKLHSILRPFLLRRLKKDVEKQLPTKTEYIIKCTLSRRQRYLYDEFINRDDTKSSMKQNDFLGLMNIVMQLKKVCNHPDLFEARTIESPFISLRLQLVVLSHFLLSTRSRVPAKLIFIDNEFSRTSQSISRSKALMPIADDFYEMNNMLFSEENWPSFIPYYAQRWRILKQFTKQQTLKRIYKTNRARINADHVMYGTDMTRFLTVSKNVDTYQSMSDFKTMTFEDTLDSVRVLINEFSFAQKAIAASPEVIITPFDSEKHNYYLRFEESAKEKFDVIAKEFHYCTIRRTLCFPSKKLLMYDCGKLNTMIQLLKQLKQRGDKVLIFTQMSRMLDIFENVLNLFNFTYVRLDGSTKIENRQKVVERFNGDPRIFCFISSTRSGGIGLNLTGANVVVFYDTDWNPAMDRQAQDRCHRIGQTRNVHIYRLISEYTIEENILLKSMQKRKLDQYIMEEGMFNTQFYEKFDVRGILGGMLGSGGKKTQEEVIDKQQMEKILERVEDKEDAAALKRAQMEEIEYVTEGAAEVASMDKDDEEQKEKAFRIDVTKFPPIFQYGMRFIQNEESLHLNEEDQNGLFDDEDELDEDEEERAEEADEEDDEASTKRLEGTPVQNEDDDDEVFHYENPDAPNKKKQKRTRSGDDFDDDDEDNDDQDQDEDADDNRERRERSQKATAGGSEDAMDEEGAPAAVVVTPVKEKSTGDGFTVAGDEEDDDDEEDNNASASSIMGSSDKKSMLLDMPPQARKAAAAAAAAAATVVGDKRRTTRSQVEKQEKQIRLEEKIQKAQADAALSEKQIQMDLEEKLLNGDPTAIVTPVKKSVKKVRFLDEIEQEAAAAVAVQKRSQRNSEAASATGDGEEDEDEENEEMEDEDDEDQAPNANDADEKEEVFTEEDKKNSLRIYKRHFLFVKKNYFV